MRILPIPDYSFPRLAQVTPEFLHREGIRYLLLDLDNTISPYGVQAPTEEMLRWVAEIKAGGIVPFIVSNNHGVRAENFSAALGIDYIKSAGKPGRRGMLAAMARLEADPAATALAGDQIYTDTLAAKRCGVRAILIQPISLKNPLLAVRYFFEIPFRLMSRKKYREA